MKILESPDKKFFSLPRWLIFLFISVVIIWGAGCHVSSKKHKTDSRLIDEFQTKKPQLNRLIQMLEEDKQLAGPEAPGKVINAENLRKQCAIESRIQEYAKLWKELNINERDFYLTYEPARGLRITSTSDNITESKINYGSEKGYCWLDGKHLRSSNTDNLDKLDAFDFNDGGAKGSGTDYRQIEGNWYLYLKRGAEAVP